MMRCWNRRPAKYACGPPRACRRCSPTAPTPRAVSGALAQQLGVDPSRIQPRVIDDRLWEREWLKDFHAMRFGARLWVCPRHEVVTDPDAVVVLLDPGLAFGTGTHATTAMCLELARCACARAAPGSSISAAAREFSPSRP